MSGPAEYFGSGNFDFEGLEDPSAPLALETDTGPRVSKQPPQDDDASDPDGFESTSVSASKVQHSKPPTRAPVDAWPSGETPDRDALSVDPVEVELVADFGGPPATVFEAPLYALRVAFRRRALKPLVATLADRVKEAEERRDDVVRSLAESLRGAISMTEHGAALFAAVSEMEKVADGRKKNLSGTNDQYQAQAGSIDAELAALAERIGARKATIPELERTLAERQRSYDRAEARRKRVVIEVRGILDVAEKAGGAPTAEQARKIEALEAQILEQKPELDAALEARNGADAALADANGELGNLERAARDAERRRGGLAAVFQKQIDARSAGVSSAEAERRAALTDVGRKILAGRGRYGDVPKDTRKAVAAADQAVVERATDLEKHLRAIDSHDEAAFKRGLTVGAGALVLFVALLLSFALRSGAPKAPAPEPPTHEATQ